MEILIVVVALVAPTLLVYFITRQRRKDKQMDWEREDAVAAKAAEFAQATLRRQDEVAAQAAVAAQLLLERQDAVAAESAQAVQTLLARQDKVAAAAAKAIAIANEKLDVIHNLVNSSMTAAMQSELIALRAQAVLMDRVIALNERAGNATSEEERAALKAIKEQISSLQDTVEARLHQQRMIDEAKEEPPSSP